MKGYSSKRGRGGPIGAFQITQSTMIKVIQARNRAVPMKRANPSANLPKASRSTRTRGSADRFRRPGVFNRSSSRSALATRRHPFAEGWRDHGRRRVELRTPPVLGQQMIKNVVNGDRADQSVIAVGDRGIDQVVGGEVSAHRIQVGTGRQRLKLGVHQAGNQDRRRFTKQPLEVHGADEPAGWCLQWWSAHVNGARQSWRQL